MKFHLSIPLPPARHRLRHGEAGGEGRFLGGHFLNVRDDELVKSHIPYVVHASTKPVLSEPSTLRPFDRSTGSRLRANGEPKGSCFGKLSRTEYQ